MIVSHQARQRLTTPQKTYLEALGLSRDAIRLYALLVSQGSQTAQQAATALQVFPSALYRLFYELEGQGLVRRQAGRPRAFSALPLQNGLTAALAVRQQQLARLLALSTSGRLVGESQLRLLVGRQALYSEYARQAALARHSIAIYAIGIAYSPELVAAQRAVMKRGVQVRHAVQQLKPSNYHVVHTWQRMGVRVRLSPSERGFHLMLFDSHLAIISFSNPADTDDRLSIVTDSPAAVRLLQADFETLWHEAREISS